MGIIRCTWPAGGGSTTRHDLRECRLAARGGVQSAHGAGAGDCGEFAGRGRGGVLVFWGVGSALTRDARETGWKEREGDLDGVD